MEHSHWPKFLFTVQNKKIGIFAFRHSRHFKSLCMCTKARYVLNSVVNYFAAALARNMNFKMSLGYHHRFRKYVQRTHSKTIAPYLYLKAGHVKFNAFSVLWLVLWLIKIIRWTICFSWCLISGPPVTAIKKHQHLSLTYKTKQLARGTYEIGLSARIVMSSMIKVREERVSGFLRQTFP